MNKQILFRGIAALIFAFGFSTFTIEAQTSVFTYQGKLIENGNPANANYDFECKLYDALTGGTLLNTRTRLNVAVTGGVFTVTLDFPTTLFDGSDRYLEIGVRTAGSPGGYQALSPRQPLTSAPYAFRSLTATSAINATNATTAQNALQLGGVAANQYVITTDSRLSDARNPLPNSGNYIQNTINQQTTSNFNISGNGTIGGTLNSNLVNATTQYNIGGTRIMSTAGVMNLFVGVNAGASGSSNAFFGSGAGAANTTGASNTFVGRTAGAANTTGISNTFIGRDAGIANTIGLNNTIIGANADVSGNLDHATAIGADAIVSISNSIVLGRPDGSDAVRIPGAVLIDGSLVVHTLGSAGSTQICLNSADRLAPCSSSLRYKTNVESFLGGLDVVRRLRPITFNWKEGGMPDIGFGAEEVFQIEPRLTIRSKQGEIEGVKYNQMTTVLVNAIKEQQAQIEAQQKQIIKQNQQIEAQTVARKQQQQLTAAQQKRIEDLQTQISILKAAVCQANPQMKICREEKK